MKRDAKNYTTKELLWMFNNLTAENEMDQNWLEEMYTELTVRGYNSDGTKIQWQVANA